MRGLAEALGVAKAVATRSLDKLEAAKLLKRVPDPSDRRSVRLVTTPTGRARYREMTACMKRLIEQENQRSPATTTPPS